MEKTLETLKERLQEAFKETPIIVDDITFEEKGKYHFLTVILDKEEGIDLEEIVKATETINQVVDKMEISDSSYILDVVSKERG